jgi:hypothetical protein
MILQKPMAKTKKTFVSYGFMANILNLFLRRFLKLQKPK